jgi:hypothetical protein
MRIGFYPIATFRYSSTTLYQVSYHTQQWLFSEVTIGFIPRRAVLGRLLDHE